MTPPASDQRPTLKLWALLTSEQRRRIPVLTLLMLVALVLEVLGVGLVLPAVALLVDGAPHGQAAVLLPVLSVFGEVPRTTMIVAVMGFLVVLFLFKSVFLAFVTWRQMQFTHRLEVDLAQRLMSLYLTQPYTFHLQRNSAHLINNVVIESNMVAEVGLAPLLVLVTEISVLLGIGVLLLIVEPIGAVAVTATVGAAAWIVHALMRKGITRWGQTRHTQAELAMQHLHQGLGGVKDIIVLGREQEFLNRFRWHNLRRARAAQNQATVQRFPRLALELFVITGMAALTAALLAQGQTPEAVLPTLGLFAVAAFRVMPSVSRIMNSLQLVRYAAPSISAIHSDVQTLRTTPPESGAALQLTRILRLVDVSYRYPGAGASALDHVDLHMLRGETVGIAGPSGSGKTTLVDVILGLLTPGEGDVLVDGRSIHTALRSWQGSIGYVPQVIYLTDDSLRRNVAFGVPDREIDESAVRRAIGGAQLEELIEQLPNGLSTPLGERGARLSGGQRQRIGLARALYHDPAVLILDEATSALDTATEREVLSAIRALPGSKTVIIVSHRDSTVTDCDRLYRVEQGRVTLIRALEEDASALDASPGVPR